MKKLVLFDLDGTLVNTLLDLADSCNYTLECYGFPTHDPEKYKYFVGDGMPKLVENILPKDKYTEKLHSECLAFFKKRYSEHYMDKSFVYDGIKELLSELKNRGFKIGVLSNKAHEMTTIIIEKLFGKNFFDIVYGKVEGYPAKPDPTLGLEIINDLGFTPEDTVFIGDSGNDAKISVNMNCTGIGVLWGFRDEKELRDGGADYIVNKPSEILKILEEL